jgi:hypothetical protein
MVLRVGMGIYSAVSLALAVAVFSVIGSHAREMYRDRRYREMFGALFWAIVPIAIFSIVWAVNENPSTMGRNILLGFVGAVLGAVALIWIGYVARDWSAKAQPANTGGNNVPNINNYGPSINTTNQSGGTNVINVGPTRLVFNPAIGEELASKLPSGKPVIVQGVGSASDLAVAAQYAEFLKGKGFDVAFGRIGMMSPPPDHKITLGDNGKQAIVIIAPSAL